MDLTQISVNDLPFNKIFQDYITNYKNLSSFYEVNPLSEEDVKSGFESFHFDNDRTKTVELLKEYNLQFGAGKKTIQSVERLSNEKAIAVVTGQQLTLFGGPLFTIYKILTAIHYARKWEKEFNIPCVPVFWMADEDHDYDEIAEIGILHRDDHEKISLERPSGVDSRVAEIELDDRFQSFQKQIIESQFDTDFTDQLWRQLDNCYASGKTIGESFGKWILNIFEEYGLVLAGTAHPKIKEHVSDILIQSIKKVDQLYKTLNHTTGELKDEGYHGQVHLQHSNLFWIDEKRNRVKLNYSDGIWSASETEKSWTSDELIKEIEKNPEDFSPNVFLRPLMQNELIPDFAYIAGPGEMAYYAQMKGFYEHFGKKMPVIMPRFSITLMESNIERIFEKLPFDFTSYNNRIEDLEAEFIDQSDSPDIENIFEIWKKDIDKSSNDRVEEIKEIDATLEGASESAISTFFTELDKLKGKVYRSVKEQERTQLTRIKKIKTNLFPNGNLQEREVAFIYFMNKYGLNIWDELFETLRNEDPDSHKMIRL